MASASSIISLSNKALYILGQRPISASADLASPSNDRERILGEHFDESVKTILSSHPWQEIIKREELTVNSGDPPSFQYDNRFPYPTDKEVLKLLEVWIDGYLSVDNSSIHEWRIEGNSIITDYDQVEIVYLHYPKIAAGETTDQYNTRLNTYFGSLNSALTKYLAIQLAYDISFPITNNATLKQSLAFDLQEAEKSAIAKSKRERPQIKFHDYTLLNARFERGY